MEDKLKEGGESKMEYRKERYRCGGEQGIDIIQCGRKQINMGTMEKKVIKDGDEKEGIDKEYGEPDMHKQNPAHAKHRYRLLHHCLMPYVHPLSSLYLSH